MVTGQKQDFCKAFIVRGNIYMAASDASVEPHKAVQWLKVDKACRDYINQLLNNSEFCRGILSNRDLVLDQVRNIALDARVKANVRVKALDILLREMDNTKQEYVDENVRKLLAALDDTSDTSDTKITGANGDTA